MRDPELPGGNRFWRSHSAGSFIDPRQFKVSVLLWRSMLWDTARDMAARGKSFLR